jgi:streptogramin lyase
MSHDTASQVPTAALRDPKLTAEQLAAQIQPIGKKPLSDGITLGPDGSVWLTDSAIPGYIHP